MRMTTFGKLSAPGLFLLSLLLLSSAKAEDGYDLWLRYAALDADIVAALDPYFQDYVVSDSLDGLGHSVTSEIERGLSGLLSRKVPQADSVSNGTLLVGTPTQFPELERLNLPYDEIGDEGYLIRHIRLSGSNIVLVTANGQKGLLYGVFGLFRQLQLGADPESFDMATAPRIQLRLLNHWDNLDRSVERGYAGQSIWDWWRLPEYTDQRYTDYGRANASIGINGTVLNNVNSNALILTPRFLEKVAAVADKLRPWGMKVYLSARFSAPQEIGGHDTSDPLDAEVRQWWQNKAAEIYRYIPDFGGFLVKANSEGQPGPQDFGRTHADGANMLADAVAPFGGVVMWRAFVYSDVNPEDRAKQAYSEFKPLDGEFADNVILQVKNGPIDFQPREPFHPMFGAFDHTPLMMEFQITKEYLGFATHLAYLGTMYEEVLNTDTWTKGRGSHVSDAIDGSLHGNSLTAIAGVSNIGSDRDWSGSDFNQANWYVYGRMAWNPDLSAETVASNWLEQTFSSDPVFINEALSMMMRSREAVVDYMTPLGLAHLMDTGHHYGPGPWVSELGRPEWNPTYYHRADSEGIGFDRTATGSDALVQYAPQVAGQFDDPRTIDEKFLLWFHHVPWDFEMQSGNSLWEEMIIYYDRGVAEVEAMIDSWNSLEGYIDDERYRKAQQMLEIQLKEARWWRDASLAYFMSVSGLDLPPGTEPPEHSLEYYRSLTFPNAPG